MAHRGAGIDEFSDARDVGGSPGLRIAVLVPLQDPNLFRPSGVQKKKGMGCDEQLRVLCRPPAFFVQLGEKPG
jgi:hypothetical protein